MQQCSDTGTSGKQSGVREIRQTDVRHSDVRHSGVRQTGDDILVCSSCCNETLCNGNLCVLGGATIPPRTSRGPICYSCGQQLDPSSCHKIRQCGLDQECLLMRYESLMGNDLMYKTECISKQTCAERLTIYKTAIASAFIGKRSVGQDQCALKCCDTDLCNSDCTGDRVMYLQGTSISRVTQPSSPSSPTTSTKTKPSKITATSTTTSTTSPTSPTTSPTTSSTTSSTTSTSPTTSPTSTSSTTSSPTSSPTTTSTSSTTKSTTTAASIVAITTKDPTKTQVQCRDEYSADMCRHYISRCTSAYLLEKEWAREHCKYTCNMCGDPVDEGCQDIWPHEYCRYWILKCLHPAGDNYRTLNHCKKTCNSC
ncbi:hypothetical protein ACF0H5_007272 [Mactra antiquata]